MSETLGRTAEFIVVGGLAIALMGGVALAGYAMTPERGRSKLVPTTTAAAAPEHHPFAAAQPHVLDCDSSDSGQRSIRVVVTPDRKVQAVVFEARMNRALAEAAWVQVFPPDSDLGYHDWRRGTLAGDTIAIEEYQTPQGAQRRLGTVATITAQAVNQEQITLTAACD